MGISDEEDSSEFSDVTAPLPVLGLSGSWEFAPKWSLYGRLQIFRLEVGDYDGSIDHLAIRLEHQTFRHVGFGLGYDFFELDIDISIEPQSNGLCFGGPRHWRRPAADSEGGG